MILFGNYLTVALRNLTRHKLYSLINIVGLAVGLACSIVILLLVRHDLSFDNFHGKADRIYRLYERMTSPGWNGNMTSTQGPAGPAMAEDFPEVVNYVRFEPAVWQGNYLLKFKDMRIFVRESVYTDPSIFDVFDFTLIAGDARTALEEPYTAVMTEETARNIFGDDDPLGKVFQNESGTDYRVTGILKNIPDNSHLQFDILLSTKEMSNRPDDMINNWGVFNFATYVLLEEGTDVKSLEEKLSGFSRKYFPNSSVKYDFHLQPLTDVHLGSAHVDMDMLNWQKGDIVHVYMSSLLAFIIILIACFNFMNLATARSACRAREVGIRKVVGARKTQLLVQFLGESFLLTFIALFVAVALTELMLPFLNRLFPDTFVFNYLSNPRILTGLIGLTFLVGLTAGSYPAFFLSAFQPLGVLKESMGEGRRGLLLKKDHGGGPVRHFHDPADFYPDHYQAAAFHAGPGTRGSTRIRYCVSRLRQEHRPYPTTVFGRNLLRSP